jgi:aminopeptidase YwaD
MKTTQGDRHFLINTQVKRQVKEELSGENAKTYVAEIARFHRIQASTMFHQAAEHVKNTVVSIGLRDAKIEQFQSDGAKKYGTHISPMGWEVKSAELRLVTPEQQLLARYADTPTCLHTCSNATPPEGITAELVDVGKGTKPEDYEDKNVKGKLVLATDRAKLVHEQAVYKRGAAGVITDTLAYEFPNVRESVDIPDAHSYQSIWPTKDVADKVTFGFSISKRQGNRLRELLKTEKTVKLHAKVDARLFSGYLDVVTATIKGASKSSEEIFLIAHLCHPQPSANDNASGSGLLVEIARTIQHLITSKKIARPKRTIRFLWVPETYGTVAYLHSHKDWTRNLIAGINLDMVGENQELCKSALKLDRTPDSLPSYLNDLTLNLLEQSEKEFDSQTDFGSASTFRHAVNAHSGGSDHHEFVDSTVGVPCVMLLQWPDMFYHTSMDTVDKVSVDSLKRVGWITTVAALTLANADTKEAYFLANEVYSRGATRIEEAQRQALQALMDNQNDSNLRKNRPEMARTLTKTANLHKYKIDHIAKREKQAVHSVKRLANSIMLNKLANSLGNKLSERAEQTQKRIEDALAFVAKAKGVSVPARLEESKAKTEAKRIVPRRLFKGTLSLETLRLLLGEEEYSWYQEQIEKDLDFKKKIAEIVNYINGKNTLQEILKAVSAEYTYIAAEQGLKIVRDLERVKLVALRDLS